MADLAVKRAEEIIKEENILDCFQSKIDDLFEKAQQDQKKIDTNLKSMISKLEIIGGIGLIEILKKKAEAKKDAIRSEYKKSKADLYDQLSNYIKEFEF